MLVASSGQFFASPSCLVTNDSAAAALVEFCEPMPHTLVDPTSPGDAWDSYNYHPVPGTPRVTAIAASTFTVGLVSCCRRIIIPSDVVLLRAPRKCVLSLIAKITFQCIVSVFYVDLLRTYGHSQLARHGSVAFQQRCCCKRGYNPLLAVTSKRRNQLFCC